tara:strand:- start:2517 stop:2909 length:393 start_codon:yes stop_codon:yes gene_type:complete
MSKHSGVTDKAGMILSSLCVIHCLFLPVIILFLPSALLGFFESESFHLYMLAIALPVSCFAFLRGFRHHQKKQSFLLGLLGMALLISAVTIAEMLWGELGETLFTVCGGFLIVYSHYVNLSFCRKSLCSA